MMLRLVDYSISWRTNVALAAIFAMILILSLTGWLLMRSMNADVEDLGDNVLNGTRSLAKMQYYQARARTWLLGDVLNAQDPAKLDEAVAAVDVYRHRFDKEAELFTATIPQAENRGNFDEILSLVQAYRQSADKVAMAVRAGDRQAATQAAFVESRARFSSLMDAIDRGIAFQDDRAEVAINKALATYRKGLLYGGLVVVLVFAIGAFAAWMVARTVAKPARDLSKIMTRLAQGDLKVAIIGVDRGDEIGDMAKAVQVFKDTMNEAERLRATQDTMKREAELARRQALDDLATRFEQEVGSIVEHVAAAAGQLEATAQSMADVAKETTRQAGIAAGAAQTTSHNVQTVAAATEELSASIQEISRQITRSGAMISDAAVQARVTNERVRGLTEAAQKIGSVVKIIAEIAGQTNLLALNATIEAARAGAAGKGFAVVAAEVKALANQTAKATDEITLQVKAIQDATEESAHSIEGMAVVISDVNETSSAIAASVEEQNSATQEISRSVQAAAGATGEMSNTIDAVNSAAVQTGTSTQSVLAAARVLSGEGAKLRDQVGGFLSRVRS